MMVRCNGRSVKIKGTGRYIPERIMSNRDFEKIVDTTGDWIKERTGILERHFAADGETCADMAAKAAEAALEDSGLAPEAIDMVIFTTNSPGAVCPITASVLQGRLKAVNAGAQDVFAGCTGSLAAMISAASGISCGIWDSVLVVGSERFGDIIDWRDRGTCVLFGDGAGACVLSASDAGRGGFKAAKFRSAGELHDMITIDRNEKGEAKLSMNGRGVFKFVSTELPAFIDKFCKESGVCPGDMDFWLFHQANTRIIESVFKRLSISAEKTWLNLHRYGNTSAASLFIVLDEAVRAGKVKAGDNVMFTAFGAGMTLGAAIYEA